MTSGTHHGGHRRHLEQLTEEVEFWERLVVSETGFQPEAVVERLQFALQLARRRLARAQSQIICQDDRLNA